MTEDQIRAEWDAFIEHPDGSDKLYVTRASALIFARVIAKMAAQQEREACAKICEMLTKPTTPVPGHPLDAWLLGTLDCAAAIRARGEK